MSDEKDSVMLLPTSFYDKLDPKYREKLVEFEKTLKREKSTWKITTMMDFLNQFMMLKEFWDKLFERDIDVEELCYPQKYLEKKFVEYEKTYACNIFKTIINGSAKYIFLASFIPISIVRSYEKMKSLYSKIKLVEENEDEWFKALKEVEDGEFIEHNIEYRIGSDLTNKKLWKMYIEYLKKNNQEKLLQTYSKYCRFFLNDTEMIEEYRKSVGDKKVTVPWINTFDFEIYDPNYFDETAEPKITVKPPLTCFFNAENALPQRFPFKPNLMFYILKNANAYVLHNLFKSCKWFYPKNPVSVCYKVEPNYRKVDHLLIKGQSLSFSCYSFLPKRFEKLFISTKLTLTSPMFPHFIARIYRCTAKYISLNGLKLSNQELNMLIGYGNVEELDLWNISDSKNDWFILEDLLSFTPKIKDLSIRSVFCTPKTSEILCELPFENKINSFSVSNIKNTLLEPNGFAIFMQKNISPNSEIHLHFDQQHPNYIRNFKEAVNNFIEENWKENEDKPLFSAR
uniref:F-box domain-containing protein n=1 Tax=Panagrolaimus davidi TaxID=227884 RepID=A0A914QT47_9BILA